MRNGLHKYLVIYEEAVSHIWLCTRSVLDFLIGKCNFLFYQCTKFPLNWTLVSWQSNYYFLQRFAKGTTPDIRSRRYKLASKASGLHLIQDSWEYRYAYRWIQVQGASELQYKWEYRYGTCTAVFLLYRTAENSSASAFLLDSWEYRYRYRGLYPLNITSENTGRVKRVYPSGTGGGLQFTVQYTVHMKMQLLYIYNSRE